MTSDNLQAVMADLNLNVKKLAAGLHVSERTLYQWLKGTRRIPEWVAEFIELKFRISTRTQTEPATPR